MSAPQEARVVGRMYLDGASATIYRHASGHRAIRARCGGVIAELELTADEARELASYLTADPGEDDQ